MPALQPEQAAFLLQMYLPTVKSEHATTLKIIQAIPVDKGSYSPEPVARSADELAWHIVAIEQRFLSAITDGKFNYDPIPRPEGGINSANVSAWYVNSFKTHIERVANTPPEKLAQVVDFRGLFQLPAVAYLQFILGHSIHHRGQLSTYLRPMGSEVPSIYGESYDAAQARKAAEAKA